MLEILGGSLGAAAAACVGGLVLGSVGTLMLRPDAGDEELIGGDDEVAPGPPAALVDGVIAAYDLAGDVPAVQAHLTQILRDAGVRQIEVAAGAGFDPGSHHAVGTEPGAPNGGPEGATDGGTDGCVARVVRPGWRTEDKVLRPAEVIVWKT